MTLSSGRLAFSVVGMFAVLTAAARAQAYGPGGQVITIGAAEFQPESSLQALIGSDGYQYLEGGCCAIAPLSLPEGALIEEMCLYAYDAHPGYVGVDLMAAKLVPAGENPHLRILSSHARSESSSGYGSSCRGPFEETIRGRLDVDGDGNLDAVAYYVYAYATEVTPDALGFGGVQIHWRRQVSAAPSTPTFADVPDTDPAFAAVEALAASGITAGCAGGNYCPDGSLTRRQTAIFLSKAVGLHWPN